ncbi:MAG: response regulator [Crocinitomicaceae bacterium]|jgi:DNA-binding NtrC family response regulator|nr:response regulator [Crocinitomicaceae bacterium]
MSSTSKIKLFLVDDDPIFLKSLEIEFLQHGDFAIETYPTGELCVQNLENQPDVIILDFHLNGIEQDAMNGLETLDKIKAFNEGIPVIMLSSQDKIEVAVECMHHKALDYVVKSETAFFRLQKMINSAFEMKKMAKELNWYVSRM